MAKSSMRTALTLAVALLLTSAPFVLADDDEAENESHDQTHDDDASAEVDANESETEQDARDEEEDARDEEEDEREDEREGDEAKREVKVLVEGSRALFELEREDARTDGEEEVKLDYDADEGVLKLEFAREAGETESSFEYKLELERVIEYVDLDGNGVFDEDVDEVVSEFSVDEDMTWTVLGVEDVTAGNTTGKKIVAEGTFKDANGTMGLVFYAFGDFTDLNGTSLKPTEIKFDFVFRDYPYQNASSALALELAVEYESEYESERGDAALNATAGDVTGYFTWADWAFVDGVETPVGVSGLHEERETSTDETRIEQRLYLNYARGAEIVHDPILGVAYSTATTSTDTSGDSGSTDGATSGDDAPTTTSGGSGDARKNTTAAGVIGALATIGLMAVTLRGRRRG